MLHSRCHVSCLPGGSQALMDLSWAYFKHPSILNMARV